MSYVNAVTLSNPGTLYTKLFCRNAPGNGAVTLSNPGTLYTNIDINNREDLRCNPVKSRHPVHRWLGLVSLQLLRFYQNPHPLSIAPREIFQKNPKFFSAPPPPIVKREAPAPSPRPAKRRAGSFQKSQCKNIIFRFFSCFFHKFDGFPLDKFGYFGKIDDNKNEERGNEKAPQTTTQNQFFQRRKKS